MKQLTLQRVTEHQFCTCGVLLLDGKPLNIVTAELPWRQNRRVVSCIPRQVYTANLVFGAKTSGGTALAATYRLEDVPNRSGILIHPLNVPFSQSNKKNESQGCIGVGKSFRSFYGWGYGVADSKKAFEELIDILDGEAKILINVR